MSPDIARLAQIIKGGEILEAIDGIEK